MDQQELNNRVSEIINGFIYWLAQKPREIQKNRISDNFFEWDKESKLFLSFAKDAEFKLVVEVLGVAVKYSGEYFENDQRVSVSKEISSIIDLAKKYLIENGVMQPVVQMDVERESVQSRNANRERKRHEKLVEISQENESSIKNITNVETNINDADGNPTTDYELFAMSLIDERVLKLIDVSPLVGQLSMNMIMRARNQNNGQNIQAKQDLEIEQKKQEIELAKAKTAQELAIAERIHTSENVEIEELYEDDGQANIGANANKQGGSIGASAKGSKVVKRTIRFTGKKVI